MMTTTFTSNETEGERRKVACAECKNETNHSVMQSFSRRYSCSDGGFEISGVDHYEIIQCNGCDSVTFRECRWFSEHDEATEMLYPHREVHSIRGKNFYNAPVKLRQLYREVVDCYNLGSYTLCAAGLRALVEGIAKDKGVNDGVTATGKKKDNLEGKICGMSASQHLSKDHAGVLHNLRFMGNEAVHEVARATREELALGIEIIEQTLSTIYEHSQKFAALKKQSSK